MVHIGARVEVLFGRELREGSTKWIWICLSFCLQKTRWAAVWRRQVWKPGKWELKSHDLLTDRSCIRTLFVTKQHNIEFVLTNAYLFNWYRYWYLTFTKLAPRPIQPISRDVRLSVPFRKPQFSVDWRLLIKECIANIAKLEDSFSAG